MHRFSTSYKLSTLLGNVSEDTFFKEYWQAKPLLVSRGDTNFYHGLISISDLDIIISTTSLRPDRANLRLVRSTKEDFLGEVIPETRNGLVDMAFLYQKYSEGFTLVIHRLEQQWLPLTHLAAELYDSVGAKITIGLYLTPVGSQGLAPHSDSYEIFIMQISGAKTWKVYDVPQEVAEGPMISDSTSSTNIKLLPGDLLYLPRYIGHEAICSDDSSSLHLTVAVHVTQVVDVIISALKETAKTQTTLRRAVSLNRESKINVPEIETAFWEISKQLSFKTAIEKVLITQIEELDIVPDGHFNSLDFIANITLNSIVRRRTPIVYIEECNDEICAIRFPGNKILAPNICLPAFHYIKQNEHFAINSIPGQLSNKAKLILIKRLIVGGLISIMDL
jgi:ribosomal protein L16 Arg81 hydroxylase